MKKLLFLLFPIMGFAQGFTINEIRYQENDSTAYIWYLNGKLTDYNPVTLTPQEVFYNYVKIQKGKQYKKRFEDCIEVANAHLATIDKMQLEVDRYEKERDELKSENNGIIDECEKLTYDLGLIHGKKKQFYEKPVFLIAVGFAAGTYLGIQISK